MERCTATVRLGGDLTQTVIKSGVSPAEIAILRLIHGDDSVVDVERTDVEHTNHPNTQGEPARLKALYGAGTFAAAFPGARPTLPEKLSDIGIELPDEDIQNPLHGRKGKPKKKADAGADKTDSGVQPVTAADLPDASTSAE